MGDGVGGCLGLGVTAETCMTVLRWSAKHGIEGAFGDIDANLTEEERTVMDSTFSEIFLEIFF
jgi:hypothetical protein